MKHYAKEALERYGVANYVVENKTIFDQHTDEMYIYNVRNTNIDDIVDRLRKETFSISAKSYPRHGPSAPAKSPRAVIISRNAPFKPVSQNTLDKIVNRLTQPTHSHKMHLVERAQQTRGPSCKNSIHTPRRQKYLPPLESNGQKET